MANSQNNCIFCKIINSEAPSEKIYEDDDVICISDINPASDQHYLIIPKTHISDAKSLKPEHETLYDKIVNTVEVIAAQQSLDVQSLRTGFHWPPFVTVHHLHLHVIHPVAGMNFLKRQMFRLNSLWFVSTDYVKSRFKNSD